MPWSQVVARKRTMLMHATSEHNVYNNKVFLDMTSKSESSVQFMSFITEQFPSQIAVATTKEGSRKIAEINFNLLDPAIGPILKDDVTFENDTIGSDYAILLKDDGRFSALSHHLPWYESEDEGFYAVWSDMSI
ncbi:hypothetical protein G6F61_003120 [Rhizopus arrhizus]|nr:hypothetical protein G6F61_003120 [Rhizopus arrhizus]